jgi:membrane fusion protein (multidrug efflux system)
VRKRFLLLFPTLSVLALLGVGAVGCKGLMEKLNNGDSDDDDSAEEEATVPVTVQPARRGSVEATVGSSSTVASLHQVDLIAEVSGTVVGVKVEEGDAVAKGAVLATLDNPLARGERDRTLASFRKAEEDLERLRPLHAQGFISQNEWNEAVHAHGLAKTSYEQAQASLDDTVLRAPFAGTVTFREIEVGENVTVGKRVFQVVDMEHLEVEIHLPERHLSELRVAQMARIHSDFTDLSADGEVVRIHPTVDPATGTVKVTVGLRQETPVLRPGMFVNVDVVTATQDDAILVPKRALVYEDGEPVVYLVREELAVRVRIGPGQEQGDEREVAEGIAEGEPVIVMGQTALKDGALVTVQSQTE